MRKLFLFGFACFYSVLCFAHEGMWIPSLLVAKRIGHMQSMGLKLSAEDIYSVNKGSLKDAICQFGGGCTAEVISSQGLILTNHHCGYSQIQSHSSLEKDYLTDGFWAMTREQELPNAGLTAMFVVRIEDVTEELAGLSSAAMRSRMQEIRKNAMANTHYESEIVPFNYGNSYFLIVTETFLDVRLVGAPPGSVGKFGHDTDNWVWPRHTGDFSLFRIYAGKDNKPAPYGPDNVPYTPKHHLPVSLEGVKPGDFTMVYGFPGRTQQFLPSYAVDYIVNKGNVARIKMRDEALAAMNAAMKADKLINIQYASKQSRIANGWKKWIGESFGLKRTNAIAKKQAFESEFTKLVNQTDKGRAYRSVLSNLEKLYVENEGVNLAYDYYSEYLYYGAELLRFTSGYTKFLNAWPKMTAEERKKEIESLKQSAEGFYKNYNAGVDERIMKAQSRIFATVLDPKFYSAAFLADLMKYKNNTDLWVSTMYSTSVFASKDKLFAFLDKLSAKSIVKMKTSDLAWRAQEQLLKLYEEDIKPNYGVLQQKIVNELYLYTRGIRDLMPDRTYWFDANSTLRLTYGMVEGSAPMDGMRYDPFTTMDGIMQKYKPGDYEFDVPKRLVELWEKKDYGRYGTNGQLTVCFTGSNHTTGGNSGSPALNGDGHLVGLNFDRSWESTMSDVMYDASICRNIMVDIRYVLFIIDKYAGAGHLVEEMTLVTKEYREEQHRKELMKQVSELTRKLGDTKDPSEILSSRGKLYYAAGMFTEARADFDAVLRTNKDNAEVLVWKGKAEIGAGNCPDAVKTLTRAVQLNSKIFDGHFYKGIAFYEKGDYNEAIKAFSEAILLKPDSYKAYYNRGVCKHLLGRHTDGCTDLDMAQKLGGNKEEWIYQTVCDKK